LQNRTGSSPVIGILIFKTIFKRKKHIMKFTYSFNIDEEIFADMFESLFDSITHWCRIEKYDSDNYVAQCKMSTKYIHEGQEIKEFTITLNNIVNGFQALCDKNEAWCKRHIKSVEYGDYDAETVDVLIQMSIFNDVIFG
jgi:hypothetical protein